MSIWTQGLNPEQIEAVHHDHGPMLILAGAGSGKTTVLVARTGRLISDKIVRAENTLVLTFTNKAARELKHRVSVKVGDLAKGLWAGTFHSFGLRLLREFNREADLPPYFGILDQSDSQSILKEILRDVKIAGKDKFDLDTILELINQRRVRGRERTEGFDEYHEMAEILLPKYLKKLDLLGAVDFEGLLLKPIELLKNHPHILNQVQQRFQQVMVDEFQDTNMTQMKLIDAIVREHRNITVVGDDDQSIYGWRGAEVKNILNFPQLYSPCQVIRLERNYRSTPAILFVANDVIAKNKHRHGKVLRPEGAESFGDKPELFVLDNEEEESEFAQREIREFMQRGLRAEDIAVLYRSNSQGGMLESVLRAHQIPYRVSGGTAFFDRKEIKDILSYLRFSLQPNDVSLRRIINTPPRGIGDTSIEKINLQAKNSNITFVKACADWRTIGLTEKTGEALDKLLMQLKGLPARIMSGPDAGAQLLEFFRSLGYRDHLYHTSSSGEAGEKKWILVEIFARILDSFVAKGGASEKTLREFVDSMELRDNEEDQEKDRNKVSLMTLHASKGLEFPLVLLLGVEEDLLPHKTLGTNVDEERRLFYVGLTRAKKHLILTRCRQRKKHGQNRPVTISRFLLEIDKSAIRSYENGMRPVSGEQRDRLVADFMSQLETRRR